MESEPCGAARARPSVALASIPVVYGADDAGGEATAPGTADVLELRDPPRASDLVLPERLAPGARRREFDYLTYIVAVGPARLLVAGTQGPNLLHPEYLDVRARTAARVPAVPRELADTLSPRHATGLIADPCCPAHDVVALAQRHPAAGTSMTRQDDALLCYSTATGHWELDLPPTARGDDDASTDDAGTVLQPPPGGRWVILNARVRASNVSENISFHWEAPPRVSTLFIDAALIPEAHEHLDATVRINSVDPSGWLLLEATHARGITLILCNALARSAAPLPVAGRPPTVNARSLGLIPVPDARGGGGHCMVAHLKPFCGTNRASLAWYDTRTEVWEENNVTCTTILPELWSSSVVISNAGKLWWFDLNNGGILSCDPFTQNPCSRLIYIPWCTARLTSSDVRRHSCLGLADGRIRLVRVIGRPDSPTIIMSALNSAEGPSVSDIWTDEFVVPFRDIQADPDCTWSELIRKNSPDSIAVIHPKNAKIVCFLDNFNGTPCIYGADLLNQCIIESQAVALEQTIHSSLSVVAWELPPTLPGVVRPSSTTTGCNNDEKPWRQRHVGRGLRGVLNFKASGSGGLS